MTRRVDPIAGGYYLGFSIKTELPMAVGPFRLR
jgi:hypothetical protein